MTLAIDKGAIHEVTHTIDNRDASRDATPATIIVARVNFCPVPPERTPAAIVGKCRPSYDALEDID